ncbi:MAG TPA: cyclophilin-like fold protein [Actinomycetaceae bacterium]|nr:cyclophilin-like fold protein [Actinomycetaceae bacterium]
MRIILTVDGTEYSATLNDSSAARDFTALLPLTLPLKDFNSAEKITELPEQLSTKDAPDGTAATAGDLSYYAPWANLAIIYRDFESGPGLFSLGRLDSDLGALPEIADGTTVTITAAE